MKRIYAREEVCMACRLCEIYCLVEHSQSKDIVKAFNEEIPRAVAAVVVEENKPFSFALQCRHCEDPPCVEACLTGAMHKDPVSGAVKHNKEKCVGCWTCIAVCPFGAVVRDTEGEKKVISKCDLCGERETPACVEACPNEALVYEERE